MRLSVTLVAETRFYTQNAEKISEYNWSRDPRSTDAEALTEFMGRACYQSWDKPNPKTAANADYLAHIEDVGHWSVIEHGVVTFYVTGVSRSLTHELVRHRHFSPSQLSQRFVVLDADVTERTTDDFVVPPLFRIDDDERLARTIAGDILLEAWNNAVDSYGRLIEEAEYILAQRGVKGTAAKKQAREAARAVLPNMTPTAIGLTGNHRAWREFLLKRHQPEADREIYELAQNIFEQLSTMHPSLYQDLEVRDDGGLLVIGT